jgi:hypothetical protein
MLYSIVISSYAYSSLILPVERISYFIASKSLIASWSAFFLFDEAWWVKWRSYLLIFFKDPTLAKSRKSLFLSINKIRSTAIFVRAQTKIFISVSPIWSSSVQINRIIATSRYDFPQPNAPWTRITLDSEGS